jgi:hypothetical protein
VTDHTSPRLDVSATRSPVAALVASAGSSPLTVRASIGPLFRGRLAFDSLFAERWRGSRICSTGAARSSRTSGLGSNRRVVECGARRRSWSGLDQMLAPRRREFRV